MRSFSAQFERATAHRLGDLFIGSVAASRAGMMAQYDFRQGSGQQGNGLLSRMRMTPSEGSGHLIDPLHYAWPNADTCPRSA